MIFDTCALFCNLNILTFANFLPYSPDNIMTTVLKKKIKASTQTI